MSWEWYGKGETNEMVQKEQVEKSSDLKGVLIVDQHSEK